MDSNSGVKRDSALALSGGGYRATLFHLGSLIRLNELGWLKRLQRVTSVSGGSITAAALALSWKHLKFDASGICTNFSDKVVMPVFALTNCWIDLPAILLDLGQRIFTLGIPRISESLPTFYDLLLLKRVHHQITGAWPNPFNCGGCAHYWYSWAQTRNLPRPLLKDLPGGDGADGPQFIFYATNAITGASVKITRRGLYDYNLGELRLADWPVSKAVAASSAFPPVLAPVCARIPPDKLWHKNTGHTVVPISRELPAGDLQDHPWAEFLSEAVDLKKRDEVQSFVNTLTSTMVLQDGGVYDNLGLEAVTSCGFNADGSLNRDPDLTYLFVSDASYPMLIKKVVPATWYSQGMRSLDITFNQVRALRKRILINSNYNLAKAIEDESVALKHADRPPRGAFWSAHSNPDSYELDGAVAKRTKNNQELGRLPTRLCGYGPKLIGINCTDRKKLVNWGYAMADTAIRKWVYNDSDRPPKPDKFPFNEEKYSILPQKPDQ